MRTEIFAAGAEHWILRPVTRSGRAESGNLSLSEPQLEALLHFATESLWQGYDLTVAGLGFLGPLDSMLNMSPFFAHAGWDSCYLLPDGRLKGFNEEILPVEGHLLKDDLQEVWQHGFRTYREAELPAFCHDCRYLGRCYGGNLPEAQTGTRCLRPLLEKLEEQETWPQWLKAQR